MLTDMLRKTKARWLRFWHCLSNGFNIGHRMEDMMIESRFNGIPVSKETTLIGCECGKIFYEKKS